MKMEFEKVREVISEQMGIDGDDIKMETSFIKDLHADSLDILQIINDLEEAFGMEFTDNNSENYKTVADVVNYIKKALS